MAEPATRTRERWLLPIPEASAALGVGRSTVYLLAKNGDIEIVHVGSRALVPAASIDAFVAKLRAGQGSGGLMPAPPGVIAHPVQPGGTTGAGTEDLIRGVPRE